jgi:signal transduction histidine kinase
VQIQTRIMMLTAALTAVLVSMLLVSVAVDKRSRMKIQFAERTTLMVDGVERIARESLRSHDDVMLLSYLRHLITDRSELEFAAVSRPGYSSVLGEVKTPLEYRILHVALSEGETGASPSLKPGTLEIQLGLSKAQQESAIKRETLGMLRRLGAIALAGLLLGLAGSWWVSRTLAEPIAGLAARLETFTTGKPAATAKVTGDEVAFLSARFDEMTSRIQEHMQLREDLLMTLTHELSNPLSGIKGLLSLVTRNRLADHDTKENYKTMAEAISAMELSLTNALHLLRANVQPTLDRRNVSLNKLVQQVTRLFRPVAQANEVRLEDHLCAEDIRLDADEELLRRIVINLVSNACKYTPPGGFVKVTLEPSGDGALLSVSDSGPGIAPADRELIFTRFYRVPGPDGRAQRIPGSGLGLAIAKQAAELHHARIWVDSEPGRGSVFRVAFPNAAAHEDVKGMSQKSPKAVN